MFSDLNPQINGPLIMHHIINTTHYTVQSLKMHGFMDNIKSDIPLNKANI